MKLDLENINNNQLTAKVVFTLKVLAFNYYAFNWEPLIEKTSISLDVSKSKQVEKFDHIVFDIKVIETDNNTLNINISDLSVRILSLKI